MVGFEPHNIVLLGQKKLQAELRKEFEGVAHYKLLADVSCLKDSTDRFQFIVVCVDGKTKHFSIIEEARKLFAGPLVCLTFSSTPLNSTEALVLSEEFSVENHFHQAAKLQVFLDNFIFNSLYHIDLYNLENKIRKNQNNPTVLASLAEDLQSYDSENVDFYKTQAILAKYLKDEKTYVSCLNLIRKLDPNDMWATNRLVQYYLERGRSREGINILSVIGADKRISLDKIGSVNLSYSTISFLNLRAVGASKEGAPQVAIQYYLLGVNGSKLLPADKRSKLVYNLALAYVKIEDFEKAIYWLRKSLDLSGNKFEKARLLLQKVNELMLEGLQKMSDRSDKKTKKPKGKPAA